MTTYDFTLVLSSPAELTDEFADTLFSAGCDDGTPSSANGVVSVDFSREGSDLESAIRSAVAHVAAVGGIVDHVEIDANAPALKS
jgi:hypothetical protein